MYIVDSKFLLPRKVTFSNSKLLWARLQPFVVTVRWSLGAMRCVVETAARQEELWIQWCVVVFLKTYRIHVWYTLPETNIAPRSHQGISPLPSPLNFTSWNLWICTIIPVYTFTCAFSSTLTPFPFPFYLLLSTLPLEPGESESLEAIRGFWQTIWDRPRPEVDDAFQFWQAQTLLDCQNCNGPISRRKNFKVRL